MERYAVASGNWSSPATWDGGVSLPAAGDDVYANGFSVTIDQSITVNSLRNIAGSTAVAGGGFINNVTNKTIAVTADITAGTISCLSCGTAGSSLVLNVGTIQGGTATSIVGVNLTFNAGTNNVAINATNILGGSGISAVGINISATFANITINATTVAGGTGTTAHGISQTANGASLQVTATISNLNGGSAGSGVGFNKTGTSPLTLNVTNANGGGTSGNSAFVGVGGAVTLNVTNATCSIAGGVFTFAGADVQLTCATSLQCSVGTAASVVTITNGSVNIIAPSVLGGTASNQRAFVISGGRTRILGNVIGGSANGAHAILHNSLVGAPLSVVGNVTGGTHAGANGINSVSGGLRIEGNVHGSTGAGVVVSTGANQCDYYLIRGNTINGASPAVSNGGNLNQFIVIGAIEAGSIVHTGTGITDQISTGGAYAFAV